MDKPVVVIGAGYSGMTAVKACLESGLNVICFEKMNVTGGLWRYREEDLYGVGSVMQSTIINTSKEINAFSDFVPDKELPNYMHHTKMVQYFDSYVDHFKLLPHVKFEHEVVSADLAYNYDQTGQWRITVKNWKTNQEHEVIASAIMVCNGHKVYPYKPAFPGLENFKGSVTHSHSYKHAHGLEGKRVLVIGIGNSGVDISAEVSRVASQVYLSTRRGAWIQKRVDYSGTPRDLQPTRSRFYALFFFNLPIGLSSYLALRKLNAHYDHEKYNLKPEHGLFATEPTINDDLPNRILSGSVIVKRNIHRFTEHGVHFEKDKDIEYPIDAVILATGYTITYPFLSQDILPISNNQTRLFKHLFSPDLAHPTLAVIGLPSPVGSIVPVSEMQSRLAVQVFLGKIKLPSRDDMLQDIRKMQEAVRQRYVDSTRNNWQVDFLPYLDDLAIILGVKPNLWQLFWQDPRLWYAIVFGPVASYQYRLQGPHPWPGARDALVTLWHRVFHPLNPTYYEKRSDNFYILVIVLFIGVVLFLYLV